MNCDTSLSGLLGVSAEKRLFSELTMRFYPTFIDMSLSGEKKLKRVAAHSKTSAFYNFTGSVDVSELESSIRKFYNYEGADCRKNVFDEKMLENVQVQQEISSAFNLTTNEIYECINGNSHNLSIFGGKYTIHEFFNYMLPEVSIHPRIDHDNCNFYITSFFPQQTKLTLYESVIINVQENTFEVSDDVKMTEINARRFTDYLDFSADGTGVQNGIKNKIVPESFWPEHFNVTEFQETQELTNCTEFRKVCAQYPSINLSFVRRGYIMGLFASLYVLPAVLTLIFTGTIAKNLLSVFDEAGSDTKQASVRSNNAKKAKKRTKQVLVMTIVVTIVFLMCWCFQSLANLIRSIPGSTEWYGDPTMSQNTQQSTTVSQPSCQKCELKRNFQTQAQNSIELVQQPFLYKYSEWWRVFAYFNSCINPVLYFSISKSFKKQFLQFIGVAQVQKLSKRIKRRWNSSRGTFLLET